MNIARASRLYKWSAIADFSSMAISGVLTAIIMPQILHMAQSRINTYIYSSFIASPSVREYDGKNATFTASIVIKKCVYLWDSISRGILKYSRKSDSAKFFKTLNSRNAYIYNISAVCSIAILTNIVISILLRQELSLLGWLIRAGFLLMGLSVLFFNISWRNICESSLVLKLFSVHA